MVKARLGMGGFRVSLTCAKLIYSILYMWASGYPRTKGSVVEAFIGINYFISFLENEVTSFLNNW